MNAFDDDQLGALLDYAEEPVFLDISTIVRAGRRRRQRRKRIIAGAGALTLAATGSLTAELVGVSHVAGHRASVELASPDNSSTTSRQSPPATVTQSDHLLTDYPPTNGSATTIADNTDGWRAVAYIDAAGDLCFGSVEQSVGSQGACAPTDAYGDGPLVNNATGPNASAAAIAPASEAPAPGEIGVFGTVTTGETEPTNIQKVASVVVTAGDSSIHATLSPTAESMGSTTPLAGDERVWFAWVPLTSPNEALRVTSYTANGDSTGSQPLWLTPDGFGSTTPR